MRRSTMFIMPIVAALMLQQSASGQSAYEDICKNEWGLFSHWSGTLDVGDNSTQVGYAVCNLDEKAPLIFAWDAPNLTLGPGGRLPTGRCATLKVPYPAVEPDLKATISFTQGSRTCAAAAFVGKLPALIPEAYLPHTLAITLRTTLSNEQEMNSAQLELRQTRDGDHIHHLVSWNPPTVQLALSIDYFSGSSFGSLVETAKRQGYTIRVSPLGEAISQKDGELRPDRLASKVYVLQNEGAKRPLELDTGATATGLADAHLTMIDRKGMMVVDAKTSSFSTQGR